MQEPVSESMQAREPRPVPMHSQQRRRGQVQMKKILLVQQSVILLEAACLQLDAGYIGDMPALVCITPDVLKMYDVTTPGYANLIHQEQVRGLRGGMTWNRGFLAWGEIGFRLSADAEMILPSGAVRPVYALRLNRKKKVRNVGRAGAILYALTEDGVHIYDHNLSGVGLLSLEGADNISLLGRTLAVSQGEALQTFDLSQPVDPKPLRAYRLDGAVKLVRPVALGPRNTLFVQDARGGGVLLDLSQPEQSAELARFYEPPWFVDAAQVGKTLARLDPSRRLVTLYSIARTSTRLGPQRIANESTPK
jgi:hypothetical protein